MPTWHRRQRLLTVLAAMSAAACAASGSVTEEAGLPATSAASPTQPSAPAATPEPESGPITIAFAGDVHFEAQLRSRLDDPATALAPIAPQLSAADLTVVNLETSIGSHGVPEPKRFTFQAPRQAFDAVAAAGVDVVTMANNHAMDFGAGGLADTLAAVAAGAPLAVVGIGTNADAAFAPAVIDIRGTTVAVIGAHSADDPTADPTEQWAAGEGKPGVAVARDPTRLVEAVRDARRIADVVVVFMHWGIQGERCPSSSQVATATALSDAGADIVVGSHAHVVQGSGMLDETYVAYGLGNFVWYRPSPTGLLTLTIDHGRVVDELWTPALIGSDGLPGFVRGTNADKQVAAFGGLRECASLAPL